MKPLALLLFIALSLTAAATKHRGVWFWRETGNVWGSDNIVGTVAQENATVAFFNARSVKRVYGSYGDRPVTQPTVIAAWNSKLHTAGIQTQSLMSENTWIHVVNRPALLAHITARLLNFNNTPGRTLPEKFDGLHLDIEPQALPEWSGLTSAQKRGYLLLLRDTFADVRAHFVAAGQPSFPVHADLPVWFDNLPIAGGSIGWIDAADRDQWFLDIAASLTGITLMPFDRTTFSNIDNGVMWERTNFTRPVRCGLEADIGPGQTWPSVPDFHNMMETVEASYGPSGATDVQSYRLWREEIAAQPIFPVAAVLHLAPTGIGGIEFPAEPGWIHSVHYSPNLCDWIEVRRLDATTVGSQLVPVTANGPRGFWKVSRFQEQP